MEPVLVAGFHCVCNLAVPLAVTLPSLYPRTPRNLPVPAPSPCYNLATVNSEGKPFSKQARSFNFEIGAPKEINLGTGKRSSYYLEVPLSGRQLTRVKDGFRHTLARHDACSERPLFGPRFYDLCQGTY
jgi:hypothetical protein